MLPRSSLDVKACSASRQSGDTSFIRLLDVACVLGLLFTPFNLWALICTMDSYYWLLEDDSLWSCRLYARIRIWLWTTGCCVMFQHRFSLLAVWIVGNFQMGEKPRENNRRYLLWEAVGGAVWFVCYCRHEGRQMSLDHSWHLLISPSLLLFLVVAAKAKFILPVSWQRSHAHCDSCPRSWRMYVVVLISLSTLTLGKVGVGPHSLGGSG